MAPDWVGRPSHSPQGALRPPTYQQSAQDKQNRACSVPKFPHKACLPPACRSAPGIDIVPTFTTNNDRMCLVLRTGLLGLLRIDDAERLQVCACGRRVCQEAVQVCVNYRWSRGCGWV